MYKSIIGCVLALTVSVILVFKICDDSRSRERTMIAPAVEAWRTREVAELETLHRNLYRANLITQSETVIRFQVRLERAVISSEAELTTWRNECNSVKYHNEFRPLYTGVERASEWKPVTVATGD